MADGTITLEQVKHYTGAAEIDEIVQTFNIVRTDSKGVDRTIRIEVWRRETGFFVTSWDKDAPDVRLVGNLEETIDLAFSTTRWRKYDRPIPETVHLPGGVV